MIRNITCQSYDGTEHKLRFAIHSLKDLIELINKELKIPKDEIREELKRLYIDQIIKITKTENCIILSIATKPADKLPDTEKSLEQIINDL